MYNQKFVVALKSNGKVLREFNDICYIPFGSEYSILVKNLNSVRAIVHISIDGVDVCDDGLVVNANSEFDIERFIKDGNLKKGNKFKFIERTGKIEDHRGIKTEDGLIRVSFQFEKVIPTPVWVLPGWTYINPAPYVPGHWEWKPGYYPNGYPYLGGVSYTTTTNAVGTSYNPLAGSVNCSATGASMLSTGGVTMSATGDISQNCANSTLRSAFVNQVSSDTKSDPANDIGITVPGSESNQKFQTVSGFPVEDEKHVMVIRILGETKSGEEVKEPVTVKTKIHCVTCGKSNKTTSKFCSECGAALEIV